MIDQLGGPAANPEIVNGIDGTESHCQDHQSGRQGGLQFVDITPTKPRAYEMVLNFRSKNKAPIGYRVLWAAFEENGVLPQYVVALAEHRVSRSEPRSLEVLACAER